MERSEYIVFVGRFQPIHNAHLKIIQNSLEQAKNVIIVIGSFRVSIDERNPFTFGKRQQLILDAIPEADRDQVTIISHRDNLYDNDTWITGLQNAIRQITKESKSVKLIGHFKNDSSEYLTWFPQWELITQPNYWGINAVDVRRVLFENKLKDLDTIPKNVKEYLIEYSTTPDFKRVQKDYEYNKNYQARLKTWDYPINIVTADSVVLQSGHVLLIERGKNPGIGKYALPGGHLNINEVTMDCAIRELQEETKLRINDRKVNSSFFKRALVGEHVFQHPKRSLRGRIMTHAYCFRLQKGGPLPIVKGSDDAKKAFWMPYSDLTLHEENFFEDHLHIINHFIGRVA